MQTSDDLRRQLAVAEERELREALASTGGSVTAAMAALGISKPTIYRRMRKYGIEIERRIKPADDIPDLVA